MPIVIVATFSSSFYAYLFLHALENEGIPCMVQNENGPSYLPFRFGPVNPLRIGVEVCVFEKDFETAQAILEEMQLEQDAFC